MGDMGGRAVKAPAFHHCGPGSPWIGTVVYENIKSMAPLHGFGDALTKRTDNPFLTRC